MVLSTPLQTVPLSTDDDGVVLVSGTRVTLEVVIDMFNSGASSEEISLSYPGLDLADVYAVITYYLRNRSLVDTYLDEQTQIADAARARHGVNEASRLVRKRLLARSAER